jgi:hypothetical protein
MMRKTVFVATLSILLAAGLMADKSTFDPTICPVGSMKFTGYVSIHTFPDTQLVLMQASVWKGSTRAVGGKMMLMGKKMANDGNSYNGTVEGTRIASGGMVTATFQPPWAGLPLYTASLAAPTMIRFASPTDGSRIDAAGAGVLAVRWSGGTPPYKLSIHRMSDRAEVFTRAGIAAGSMDVPLAVLPAGERYQMSVEDGLRKFAYDRAIDHASDLSLKQLTVIFFNAD